MTKKHFILLIFLGLIFTGCNSQENSPEAFKPVVEKVPVVVEKVERATLEKTIPLGGLLKAQEEVFVAAKSPVFEIVDVLVAVGDEVTQGTPLVVFDSRELDLQLKQAELALQRNQELLALGAISQLQWEQTENAVENLRIQKENCLLLSPINGTVASVTAIKGQLAGGTPLVSLVDLECLELVVQVGESYINKLKKGATLTVKVPALEKEFTGVLRVLPPQLDPRTKAYPVTLVIDNPRGLLKDGMYAEVCLVTERKSNVLVIPQYAVVDDQQKKIVFVVEDEKAQMREVELGLTLGEETEVLQGLKQGEMLIVEGQYGVREASPVVVVVRGD